jgi:hypothetical protein
MSPTSARQAALEVLLEDIEPLVKRTEDLAATLTSLHAQLQTDSTALGALVREALEAQPALLEATRRLGGSAGRIEAAAAALPAGGVASERAGVDACWWRPALTGAATAAVAVASAALLAWWAGALSVHHARLGHALEQAWPALDAGTRARLEQAMRQTAGGR